MNVNIRINNYCTDNTRFADINNRKNMQRYRRKKKQGCCGSTDKEVFLLSAI